MSNNKTLKVFSSTAVAGMIAAAMMSSQAFAAVDAYSVKVGNEVYKYSRVELEKSFLDAKSGEKAALYEDFTKKLGEAKGFYAFNDTKNGYVDYKSIEAKFLESKDAGKAFDVNAFTESKDAKVLEVKTVKKAVVSKDGKVEYVTDSKEDEKGELQIKEVKALNLKQVKIEFNKAVTDGDKKDDIEDKSNYTWENKDGDEVKDPVDNKSIVDKVELDQSGKFAILTFKDVFDGNNKLVLSDDNDKAIQNQEKYKLIIDENVTGKEVPSTVEFKDVDMPKVKSVEAVGIKTIKVKFTEPVKPTSYNTDKKVKEIDKDNFEINNGDTSIDRVELVNNNTEANIVLGTKLKDKEKVNVYVKGKTQDYAGYGVIAQKIPVEVKENTEKPRVVDFKNAKKGEVTLVFNQDIKFKNKDEKVIPSEWFKDGKIKEGNDATGLVKRDQDDYKHTNDKAYAVKIDGNELTLYFDEEKHGLPNGPASIEVNSEVIETLWDVENDKIVYRVNKPEDKVKPEIRSIKQDKEIAKEVKVKFSEELKTDKAEDTDNYVMKDKEGKEWKISKASYNNDDKEVTLILSKDLDAGEYKLTVKDVEDKEGNAIETVTKKFSATEKDARQSDDLTVNLYDAGENNQKIVIDFDTKMKTGKGDLAIDNINNYTLVAVNAGKNSDGSVKKDKDGNTIYDEEVVGAFKNGKSSINVSSLYNATVKAVNDGNKVEIKIPSKDKEDSYSFKKDNNGKYLAKDGLKEFDKLQLKVGKVSDVYDNVNSDVLAILVDDDATIGVKKDNGITQVKAISTNKVEVTFDDDIDFYNEDVTLLYGLQDGDSISKIAEEAYKVKHNADGNKGVKVSNWDKKLNDDGKTVVTMTLEDQKRDNDGKFDKDEDHILNYDGTFTPEGGTAQKVQLIIGRPVIDNGTYKLDKTKSKNKYDARLTNTTGFDDAYKVLDNIAPALVDNSKRSKDNGIKSRFVGSQLNNANINANIIDVYDQYKNIRNGKNDEAVEYYINKDNGKGAIVLTFEENLNENTIKDNTFVLDQNSDYENVKVSRIYLAPQNHNKVVIEVTGLDHINNNAPFGDGFDVVQNAPISDQQGKDDNINRGLGNEVEKISTEIGGFSELKATVVEKLLKDNTTGIINAGQKAAEEKAENMNAVENNINAVKNENVTLNVKDSKITATLKKADAKLADVVAIKDIVDGKLMPTELKIGNKTIKDVKTTKAAEVQQAIVDLVNKNKSAADKKTFAQLTLADLQGESIEATINGIKYTLEVPAAEVKPEAKPVVK